MRTDTIKSQVISLPQQVSYSDDGKVYYQLVPTEVPSAIPPQAKPKKNDWWQNVLAIGLGAIVSGVSIGVVAASYTIGKRINNGKIENANTKWNGTKGQFIYNFFEGAKNAHDLNHHVFINPGVEMDKLIEENRSNKHRQDLERNYRLHTSFAFGEDGKIVSSLSNHLNHLKQGFYTLKEEFLSGRGLTNSQQENTQIPIVNTGKTPKEAQEFASNAENN